MPTMVLLVDGTVPVAADFNGNFAALNAAIGTGTVIAAYVTGDIVYASGTNTLARRAIGTSGQVLTVVGGVPDWQPAAGLTDQLSGLGLTRTSGTAITVAVGAAASDDAVLVNRALMSLTSAVQGNTAGTWVVGNAQNKLDAGSIGNNQTWHIFVILRPDTGVVDILFSQSPTAPTLPTNYTKQRRIGSRRTDGAAAILDFVQDGDYVALLAPVLDIDASNPGTSAVTATLTSVPTGINALATLNVLLAASSAGTSLYLSDLATTDLAASTTVAPLGMLTANLASEFSAAPAHIRTNTSAQIRYRVSVSDANTKVRIATLGWLDRRGKG